MALQMNYNNQSLGIVIYNAYWRINPRSGIVGGKDEIMCHIEVFKDVNYAHMKNPNPIDSFVFTFKPDLSENADNFIAQAYNYAKTLPKFGGSVDV